MSAYLRQTFAITRKELGAYLSSPIALIFLGVFLAVTLFGFFWVEAFFARNIADVRPLFRWMPVLLVFLVAEFSVQDLIERTMQDFIEVPPTPIPAPSVGPTAAP